MEKSQKERIGRVAEKAMKPEAGLFKLLKKRLCRRGTCRVSTETLTEALTDYPHRVPGGRPLQIEQRLKINKIV